MRFFALATLVGIGTSLVACGGGDPTGGRRPNVLLISADTLRWDHVGANGYHRDTTPAVDALAREGVSFRNAYSQAPHTSASHASILSSLYPAVHGVFEHGQELDPDVLTLPEAFRDAGYATGAFTQLNGPTYEQGFEDYVFLESPYEKGKGLGDLDVVFDWIRDKRDRPFFLFLHSYDVHLPYNPPQEYIDRWAPGYDGVLPSWIFRHHIDRVNRGELEMTERDYQYIVDLYDAELSRYDEHLARLFDVMRQLEVWDDTLVVFLSDHGEEFGEHGQWGRHTYSLYQELLRIPLIIRGPGVPRGEIVDAAVRSIDVAPTLLRLAGLPVPEIYMGESLQPVWNGTERERRRVVAERLGRRVMVWAGYKYFADGRLFDLEADPTEQVDVSARHPDVVASMQLELDDWLGRALVVAEGVASDGPVLLTEEEKRRLRALGYLQ